MTDVRRADPGLRRQTILILVAVVCVAVLSIVAFEQCRASLSDWLLADPAASPRRLEAVFLLLAVLLLTPLLAFAVYFWSLGERVIRAQEFPPPGLRVVRDTPIVTGQRAVSRGRLLKSLALACAIAAAVLAVLLWRLESLIRPLAG